MIVLFIASKVVQIKWSEHLKLFLWEQYRTFHVRNDDTRERLKVENITQRCSKARLRWFGHVKGRDQEYVGRKTLEMVPPGRRKRRRPKQRWMDCVNRDMRAIATMKDEVHDSASRLKKPGERRIAR